MYFARMMCGHIHEGLKAIQYIRRDNALDAIVAQCSSEAQHAFAELCKCLSGGPEKSDYEKYVGSVRHKIGFHYDVPDLDFALEDRTHHAAGKCSSLTAGPDIHSNRFEFGDDLLDTIVCRKLWGISRSMDLRAEADKIADWVDKKCRHYLQFGSEFVPRYLRRNATV